MLELDPCPECRRHVKRRERACPFCGVPIARQSARTPRRIAPRQGRFAGLALGAGFVLACSAAAYGAPPDPRWDGGTGSAAGGSHGGAACFSPGQNLDTAYDPGAIGCPCNGEADQCVADSMGRLVALTCAFGRWQAVEDGACGEG